MSGEGEDAIVWRVHKQFDRWRDGHVPNETLREHVILAIRRGRAWDRRAALQAEHREPPPDDAAASARRVFDSAPRDTASVIAAELGLDRQRDIDWLTAIEAAEADGTYVHVDPADMRALLHRLRATPDRPTG